MFGLLASFLQDFAGGQNLRFFHIVSRYVDEKKPPGCSPIPTPTITNYFRDALLLRHMWASPNFIWAAIALAFYFIFPYDLSLQGSAAQAPLSWEFFKERFPLWLVATFAYNGFFLVTMYTFGWCKRSFIPGRIIPGDKILHNALYNVSAVMIWIGFENVMAFLWATHRLPYLSNHEAFTTLGGFIRFALGLVALPLFREAHFYFAHRLLHYKPIFQQVHSLHHRNTDIEPFSGLTMHPVEHLYYYACIFPSVFFYASPFHFVWNGIHLLLSPGASHSGFEDGFQGDNFHYMHHRYFECNYAGGGAGWIDVFFGTFVDKFKDADSEGAKPRADPKATLRAPPTLEFVLYLLGSCVCVGVWAYCAVHHVALSRFSAALAGILCGFGPAALAFVFHYATGRTEPALYNARRGPLEHVLHLGVGHLVCAVPVAAATYWSLV